MHVLRRAIYVFCSVLPYSNATYQAVNCILLLGPCPPSPLFCALQVAVHVLDHALEFAHPAASSLLPSVVPLLLEACSDDDASVSLVG